MLGTTSRYRYYRVHKWISFEFSELERLIARSDFRLNTEVKIIKNQIKKLEVIMAHHADFEDSMIHALLEKKCSTAHTGVELEHQRHHAQYRDFKMQLNKILECSDVCMRDDLGYDFYMQFRLFFSENLKHFHDEEMVIMPELQRLYSDEELRLAQSEVYRQMAPDQIIQMMSLLAPYINPSDKDFFTRETKGIL